MSSPSHSRKTTHVQAIAIGAILAATACVLLLAGGVFELLDMTCAAVASLVVFIACLEYGYKIALAVYGVSALLTFLLMPTASSVLYYGLLLGYYPILKQKADTGLSKKLSRAAVKLVVFNSACGLILFLFLRLYGLDTVLREFSLPGLSLPALAAVMLALLNLFLLVYDLLLSYLRFFYVKSLRKRLFPGH